MSSPCSGIHELVSELVLLRISRALEIRKQVAASIPGSLFLLKSNNICESGCISRDFKPMLSMRRCADGFGLESGGYGMLIKPNSRFFMRHELLLKPAWKHGEPLKLYESGKTLDVLDCLQSRVDAGAAQYVLEKNDVVELTKIDVRKKAGFAVLLFSRSDPDAPPPVFRNKKKRTLRQVVKEEDEAEAVSAHLFLHLDGKEGALHFSYRSIMEEVPGLGRSYMHSVIADALRDSRYVYEDQHGEEKETYTIPTFHGVPSEKLGEALEGGEITFVELRRPGNTGGLDMDGLTEHGEKLRLSVKATSTKKSLGIIKRIQEWSDTKHWKDLRVNIRTGDMRQKLVKLARQEDAADVLFVHSEEVETKKPISQCSDSVNEELVEHAARMFRADKNWK